MAKVVLSPPPIPPRPDGYRVGGWWHESPTDDGRLICDLCPRGCRLASGERGFCFVREHRNGQMYSTTYGRSTGFCVDPIEKKPLYHFYPGTPVLSFGTPGCNLGCRFCQNWTMSRAKDIESSCEPALPEAIAEAAVQLGCRSVAFTYNDPIIWAEYAIDTARACRERGVKTVAVTSGYIGPTAREPFFDVMDAANVDLKGFSDDFYRRYTGGRLEPVLDTLRWLVRESRTWLEITNLVIPEANDSPLEIQRMCEWIYAELGPDVPLHFTAFHPDFRMQDRGPTPLETLVRAHAIARSAGLYYVYTGNVYDPENQHTYCPGCRAMVVEREGPKLGAYQLQQGQCRRCKGPIAGCFDDHAGTWGGKRRSVRISQIVAQTSVEATDATPRPDAPIAASPPKPILTPADRRTILAAAGRRVAAVVAGRACPPLEEVLGLIARTPLYGVFVTLKLDGKLRSCCGYLGQPVDLCEALHHAAGRAANEDPRFPPIAAAELEQLSIDVSLLWGLRPVATLGEDRAAEVEIGRHGVQVSQGQRRALLLPSVAVDHKLDAPAFLGQVCLKAGLSADAWRGDETRLLVFEASAIHGWMGEALATPLASDSAVAAAADTEALPPAANDRRADDDSASPLPAHRSTASAARAHAPARDDGTRATTALDGTQPRALDADPALSAAAEPPRGNTAATNVTASNTNEPWISPAICAAVAALPEKRDAAVAGGFYPNQPDALRLTVESLFAGAGRVTRASWAGAMAPHAGWIYSGHIAASVFARIAPPQRVIVFSPRHRPAGARWAIAPHRTWRLPGIEIPSDPELAVFLNRRVPELELDPVAHRREHAIEVQLPLLHRMAPEAKVLGIALGGGELEEVLRLAEQLAAAFAELSEPPLLVVSSDMNHFADDLTTRSIDERALKAVESLDPEHLHQTVRRNRISMCGALPAVLVMATLRRMGRLTSAERVGYATSSEASGDVHRVVGYAGMLFG